MNVPAIAPVTRLRPPKGSRLAVSEFRLRSYEAVSKPTLARRVAAWMVAILTVLLAASALVPWQQTSRGAGRIVAYHPTERAQTIESQVDGRVVAWGSNFAGERIAEGVRVKKGDVILELRDVDTLRADRLDVQVEAAKLKVQAGEDKVKNYQNSVKLLEEVQEDLNLALKAGISEAESKLDAANHEVSEIEAQLDQWKADFVRKTNLHKGGAESLAKVQDVEAKLRSTEAKLFKQKDYVAAAKQAVQTKQSEMQTKLGEFKSKVESQLAYANDALGDLNLAKKELAEIESKRSQFDPYIKAPRDGVIFKLFANEDAEMIKKGDNLFTLVPDTDDLAVEMWVRGVDISLVKPGREVRLQFESWPAIQFAAGWPHATLGTFGGTVAAVDATDNGKGMFRILVRPREGDFPWPPQEQLRQGVRANGWVLLDQVTLGYEIWRQLNGFPPVYDVEKEGEKKGDEPKESKKVKVPK